MLNTIQQQQPGIGPTSVSQGDVDQTRRGTPTANTSPTRIDPGNLTRHPYAGVLPDIRDVDNYSPSYADTPELDTAMQDLYAHYQRNGFNVTDTLRGKLDNLARARGITLDRAISEHHKMHDLAIAWDQAPPLDPAQMTPAQQERYAENVFPDMNLPAGYWGSSLQLGSAHVIGQQHNGLIDVFSAMVSPSAGIMGPGENGWAMSGKMFDYKEGGGFLNGTYNALASIGNWVGDALGDHAKFHDAVGQSNAKSGIQPGYGYAGSLFPDSWPVAGQVTGVAYAFGRKISDLPAAASNVASAAWDGASSLASSAWGGVKSLAGAATSAVKDLFAALPADDRTSPFSSITEQRDFGKFSRRGQSLDDFRQENQARDSAIRDTISSLAEDAWDGAKSVANDIAEGVSKTASDVWGGVKDALGFGDDDNSDQTNSGGDRASAHDNTEPEGAAL